MSTFKGSTTGKSPDRLDSLVYALHELADLSRHIRKDGGFVNEEPEKRKNVEKLVIKKRTILEALEDEDLWTPA